MDISPEGIDRAKFPTDELGTVLIRHVPIGAILELGKFAERLHGTTDEEYVKTLFKHVVNTAQLGSKIKIFH